MHQPKCQLFSLQRLLLVSAQWAEAAGCLEAHGHTQPAAGKLSRPPLIPLLLWLCAHSGMTDPTAVRQGEKRTSHHSLQIPIALFTLDDPTVSNPVVQGDGGLGPVPQASHLYPPLSADTAHSHSGS